MTDITTEDLASLPRETGEEKSTAKCPTCGEELPVITSLYGSKAPGACRTCFPEAEGGEGGQLAAQQAAASSIQEPASTEHATA